MRLVATWFLIIVTVLTILVVFSGRREPTESRSLGAVEPISPVPTWTSTAVASQEIRHERTPDSTMIGTALPPTSVPEVKNLNHTPTPQVPFATINHNMNIREGPGTNYPVIGVASVGQNLPITGKNHRGDWWQVTYNGHRGWVFGELVTAVNAERIQIALVIPAPPAFPTATNVVAALPTPKPTIVPLLTVDAIHNRMKKNEVVFESEFKGRYIRVRGRVLSVRVEMAGTEIWIDLVHVRDVWSSFGVTCRMPLAFKQQAMSVEKEDIIIVSGTVGDKFITLDIDNCRILS